MARAGRLGLLLSLAVVLIVLAGKLAGAAAWVIGGGVAGAGLLAAAYAIVLWQRVSCGGLDAAIVLDHRLQLDETLSTALSIPRDDPREIAEAQRRHAETAAAEIRVSGQWRAVLPMVAPTGWGWTLALLLIAGLLAAMPISPLKPWAGADVSPNAQALPAQVKALEEAKAFLAEHPDLESQLPPALALDQSDPDLSNIDGSDRTLRELTDLQRRLAEFQMGDAMRSLEQTERLLRGLPPGEDDAARSTRRALAKGDFQAAEESLANVQATGLNDEQVAEALDRLAEDLDRAAEEAETQQRQGGANRSESEAGEQRGSGRKGGSGGGDDAQQSDAASKEADQQAARDNVRRLASECSEAASQCRKGQASRESGACQRLATQQSQARQAGAVQSTCQGDGDGAFSSEGQGGGRGTGGGWAVDEPHDTAVVAEQATGSFDASGSVIESASMHVPSSNRAGTAGVSSGGGVAVVQEARRRAARGVDLQRVPRRYRDMVAAWFSTLPSEDGEPEVSEDTNP